MVLNGDLETHRKKIKRSPIGAPPGTLVADPEAVEPALSVTALSPTDFKAFSRVSLEEIRQLKEEWPTIWVDCVGLGDVGLISDLGKIFGLHPLALEDTVNTGQRPKVDFYDDHAFVVLYGVDDVETQRLEQIAIFFSDRFVLTFQERPGDPFDPVRKRLTPTNPNRLRLRKADYLAYALIDAIIDSYFPLAESTGDRIDRLEDALETDRVMGRRNRQLHALRRRLMIVKRSLWPLRDAIAALARSDAAFMAAETKVYFNDTLDHVTGLIELVETNRETVTSLIEMSMAMAQARTNEIINFLTVISTIFIPLTFLAGVWGMNFDPDTSPWNMPELRWYFGYPMALGSMLVTGVVLYLYFKWRKWL